MLHILNKIIVLFKIYFPRFKVNLILNKLVDGKRFHLSCRKMCFENFRNETIFFSWLFEMENWVFRFIELNWKDFEFKPRRFGLNDTKWYFSVVEDFVDIVSFIVFLFCEHFKFLSFIILSIWLKYKENVKSCDFSFVCLFIVFPFHLFSLF